MRYSTVLCYGRRYHKQSMCHMPEAEEKGTFDSFLVATYDSLILLIPLKNMLRVFTI
jgi:hypothetical protein